MLLEASAAGRVKAVGGGIAEGREAEGGKEGDDEEDKIRDCVVVGGGIAGLAVAADLEKAGIEFVLLEAGDVHDR